MAMTLAKALTYRKRVAAQIDRVSSDILTWNSIDSKREREVDVAELMANRSALVSHLVLLKLAIFKASEPVRGDILRLSELKAESTFVQRIPTRHGVEPETYRDTPDREYTAIYRKADIDRLVNEIEAEIDNRQEGIEKHNHLTEVDIDQIV